MDLPSSRIRKRVKAGIVDLRTTQFKGHDGEIVIAKIQSYSEKTCEVNLGSKSGLDKLNSSEGDEIRMIARPAIMNGEPGMVADQVIASSKSVDVSPPKKMANGIAIARTATRGQVVHRTTATRNRLGIQNQATIKATQHWGSLWAKLVKAWSLSASTHRVL